MGYGYESYDDDRGFSMDKRSQPKPKPPPIRVPESPPKPSVSSPVSPTSPDSGFGPANDVADPPRAPFVVRTWRWTMYRINDMLAQTM